MNRRTVLRGLCGSFAAASGCLALDSDERFVTSRSVEITDRGCGDRDNVAVLDYDESRHRLRIEGTLSETTTCGGLSLSYVYSQESDRLILEVITDDDASCPSCTRYYEYEATATFRETPSVVTVAHSDPEILGGVGTLILEKSGSETDSR